MIGFGEALEAIRWLLGPDAKDPVARAMFCYMVGEPQLAPHPLPEHLTDGIGPARRLIHTFPSWRGRIKDIPKLWPTVLWTTLAEDWDLLTDSWDAITQARRGDQG